MRIDLDARRDGPDFPKVRPRLTLDVMAFVLDGGKVEVLPPGGSGELPARRPKKYAKVCRTCGAAFSASTATRYCSPACRPAKAARPARPPRACAVCGAEFRPRDGRQRTCGARPCITRWQNRRRSPLKGYAEKSCVVCGVVYKSRTSNQLSCSKSCAAIREAQRAKEKGMNDA